MAVPTINSISVTEYLRYPKFKVNATGSTNITHVYVQVSKEAYDEITQTFTTSGSFTIEYGVEEVQVLVVGGGGGGAGGGGYYGGGSGGGGGIVYCDTSNPYVLSSAELSAGSVSITIGAGGWGGYGYTSRGSSGSDTTFGNLTAKGGGGGGVYYDYPNRPGRDGGSGGGAGYYAWSDEYGSYCSASGVGSQTQTSQSGQSGTCGWGSNGMAGCWVTNASRGGGSSIQGGTATPTGKTVWSSTYSAGGSAGGRENGTANSGNGGGSSTSSSYSAGSGGSGVVVVKFDRLKVDTGDLDWDSGYIDVVDFNGDSADIDYAGTTLDYEQMYCFRIRVKSGTDESDWSDPMYFWSGASPTGDIEIEGSMTCTVDFHVDMEDDIDVGGEVEVYTHYIVPITVKSTLLLEEGVPVTDFPVLVKVNNTLAPSLFETGESADTVYFEHQGTRLPHECVAFDETNNVAYFWVKCDLDPDSDLTFELHYGFVVDNNYEDKKAVWQNGVAIYHFYSSGDDSLGAYSCTVNSSITHGASYGVHYNGANLTSQSWTIPNQIYINYPFTLITVAKPITSLGHILNDSSTNKGFRLGQYSTGTNYGFYFNGATNYGYTTDFTHPTGNWAVYSFRKTSSGNNLYFYRGTQSFTPTYSGTITDGMSLFQIGKEASEVTTGLHLAELLIFRDAKSPSWIYAFARQYTSYDTYVDVGTQISILGRTVILTSEINCVANLVKSLGIRDTDWRKAMYESGDYNAEWRVLGEGEGITIWGIYQPRPVGEYYFPEIDNLEMNDALFFTVTDYMVDIHDKIDIEGVKFDVKAIQVHPIGEEKIYKMLVLKREPQYFATCKGVIS